MNKQRRAVIENNQISEVITVSLGQRDQKIMIEGKSEKLPVVIALHGGPGSPIPFCVGARGLFPEFTDKCILVCWDQYGCGINNAKLSEDMCIDDIVHMTTDLIDVLKKRFPTNKLFLFGMSWGSILAVRAANKRMDSVDGVFTYGQVLRDLMRSEEVMNAILNSTASDKVKKEVKRIVEEKDNSYDASMKMSQYVRKYTFGYTNPKEPKAPIGKMIQGMLFSPDYRFVDFKAMVVNGYLKNRSLINELAQVDLREDLEAVTVPYHIIQGDADVVTSTKMIDAFVKEINHPNLTCTIIKDSAHSPGMNGMQAVMDEIEAI